jgi:hypothetical protein
MIRQPARSCDTVGEASSGYLPHSTHKAQWRHTQDEKIIKNIEVQAENPSQTCDATGATKSS